jgi:hypothetical protein
MLTRSAVACLVLIVVTTGCRDRSSISEQFPTTPLRELAGVSMGMKAADLRAARPAAVFTAYRGYHETLGDMDVAYDFPGATDIAVRPRARLHRIMLARLSASTAQALKEWREAVAQATVTHGPPLRCEKLTGESPGIRAMWSIEDMQFEISARQPLDTGPNIVPDRVTFTISTRDAVAAWTGVVEVTCSAE